MNRNAIVTAGGAIADLLLPLSQTERQAAVGVADALLKAEAAAAAAQPPQPQEIQP